MKNSKHLNLDSLQIHSTQVHYQLSPEELKDHTLNQKQGILADSGALCINTGEFTGRSPKDRYIVNDHLTESTVWWGNINIPFSLQHFHSLQKRVGEYLSQKELYVRDCFACASSQHQISLRVVNELPWSNLFADNMFISPEPSDLKNFQPEWTVINAPGFDAIPERDHTRQHNFAIICFSEKIILVGGTGYTGEIKKGMFSVLNFILPMESNVLSMHCSANIGKEAGDTTLFFGLSGTGKTTLSADPKRQLIGDDEHGWTPEHDIFNIEGGCYAKVIDLSEEKEPDIYHAIKAGALLENVIVDESGAVDYKDASLTENTRVSYPLSHINDIAIPSIGQNPKNIFFLTCDAFGVLPAISKLTLEQAAYHFISGYTAKVAGTEEGVIKPTPSFSTCFGAPFMPLHPIKYAELLRQRILETDAKVWLLNTGWIGGSYGQVPRVSLKDTRNLLDAAMQGQLENISFEQETFFGLSVPISCPGVSSELLNQKTLWEDEEAFEETSLRLVEEFHKNFSQFKEQCTPEVLQGGPLK
jgi:phosphoenolpyruvate carboxykinase (ATP)